MAPFNSSSDSPTMIVAAAAAPLASAPPPAAAVPLASAPPPAAAVPLASARPVSPLTERYSRFELDNPQHFGHVRGGGVALASSPNSSEHDKYSINNHLHTNHEMNRLTKTEYQSRQASTTSTSMSMQREEAAKSGARINRPNSLSSSSPPHSSIPSPSSARPSSSPSSSSRHSSAQSASLPSASLPSSLLPSSSLPSSSLSPSFRVGKSGKSPMRAPSNQPFKDSRRTSASPNRSGLSAADRGIPRVVPDHYGQPTKNTAAGSAALSPPPPPNVSGQSPSTSISSKGGKYGNIVNQFEVNAPGPLAHFELNYDKNDAGNIGAEDRQKSTGISGPFAMTNEKRLMVDGLSKGRRQDDVRKEAIALHVSEDEPSADASAVASANASAVASANASAVASANA